METDANPRGVAAAAPSSGVQVAVVPDPGAEQLEAARRLEWGLIFVRWFAVGLGVYLAAEPTASSLPAPPHHAVVLGEALVGALGLGNLLLTLGTRRARTLESIRRLGLAAFVLDSLVVFGLVWTFTYTPLDATWVLMFVLPMEGALRYGMRGALASVGLALASEVAREVYIAQRFADSRFSVGEVAFRVGVDAIIALIAGWMAKLSAREALNAREQAANYHGAAEREAQARRELGAFNSVILSGLLSEGLDQALALMARSIGNHLEYDALAILIREGNDLVTRASYGVSSRSVGERLALGSGVVGTVALTGDLLLVPDVRAFSGTTVTNPVIRSEMSAPIRLDDETVGVLDVEGTSEGVFDGESLLLLKRLAEHIALVVENDRLRTQERRIVARLLESDQMRAR